MELTPYEQSLVENRMAQLSYGGVEYKLVGASGRQKTQILFVDHTTQSPLLSAFNIGRKHDRVLLDPYLRLQVRNGRTELRIVVVEDHVLARTIAVAGFGVSLPQTPSQYRSILPVPTGIRCQ